MKFKYFLSLLLITQNNSYSMISKLSTCFYNVLYGKKLFEAIKSGDLEEVKKIVKIGFNINSKISCKDEYYEYTNYPLIEACKFAKNDIAKFLISMDVDLEKMEYNNNMNPLKRAIWNNSDQENIELIKLLISKKANINPSLFWHTFEWFDIDEAKYHSPLMLAALKGYIKTCSFLIKSGADLYQKTFNDNDIFSLLIKRHSSYPGSKKSLSFFIKKIKNINALSVINNEPYEDKKQISLLHLAIKRNNLKAVELLLKNGADAKLKDSSEETPLESCAKKNNNPEILKLLLPYYPNLNDENKNLLILALTNNNINLFKYLLQNTDIDLNYQDDKGNTILHYALNYDLKELDAELIKIIIQKNCKLNIKNNNNESSLNLFIKNITKFTYLLDNYDVVKEIIKLLLNSGAYPGFLNKKEKKSNEYIISLKEHDLFEPIGEKLHELKTLKKLLFDSIKSNNLPLIIICALRISMAVFDELGNSPLHIAAMQEKLDVFKLILSIRPELLIEKNKDGLTPLEISPNIISKLYASGLININKF